MKRLDLYEKIKLTHDVVKKEQPSRQVDENVGQGQDSEPCEWQHETDWGGDYWQTGCGNAFQFTDGGPTENHFRFCPYCGRPCGTKKTEEHHEC